MSIVDLAKARAFADGLPDHTDQTTDMARDWILSLADEVESQEAALELSRRHHDEMKRLARHLETELDVAVTTLKALYSQIGTMIKDLEQKP